jgi:hypothetical protein
MSRTIRKTDEWKHRHPHTFNEIKKLDAIVNENNLEDYSISKINHIKSRERELPSSWNDVVISAYYESDYK